jgi:hypothetical protein
VWSITFLLGLNLRAHLEATHDDLQPSTRESGPLERWAQDVRNAREGDPNGPSLTHPQAYPATTILGHESDFEMDEMRVSIGDIDISSSRFDGVSICGVIV